MLKAVVDHKATKAGHAEGSSVSTLVHDACLMKMKILTPYPSSLLDGLDIVTQESRGTRLMRWGWNLEFPDERLHRVNLRQSSYKRR